MRLTGGVSLVCFFTWSTVRLCWVWAIWTWIWIGVIIILVSYMDGTGIWTVLAGARLLSDWSLFSFVTIGLQNIDRTFSQ
jgi:hypothetical protein